SRNLADEALVSPEPVRRSAVVVAAASGDGVDSASREAALPHIVRRDDDLDFLDGVETYRLCCRLSAGRPGGRYSEDVVVDGAVDLHVVVAVVATGDAHVLIVPGAVLRDADVWRGAGEVEEASLKCRQILDRFLADVCGGASAIRVDQRRLTFDDD